MTRVVRPVRYRSTWDEAAAYSDPMVPDAAPQPETPSDRPTRLSNLTVALFGAAWIWTCVGLAIVFLSGGFPR